MPAGEPGLSTPNKPKRGRGATGANTTCRAPAQGSHRPAAARGLFALGLTTAATVMSPRDERQGRASAPLRGSETLGKGHGRAHSEDTEALGVGPSLAPRTLRVGLGGRHGGSATSCFCADPCTHSAQDLNRLTCFYNFWNHRNCQYHVSVEIVSEFVCYYGDVGLAWHTCMWLLHSSARKQKHTNSWG